MAAAIAARGAGRTVTRVEHGCWAAPVSMSGASRPRRCWPRPAPGARHGALTNPFPGAPTPAGPVDLAALVGQKDELTGRLRRDKYADVAAAHGFEVRAGHARFAGPDRLLVDGRPLPARAYLIATGSEPGRPELPGLEQVDPLTSTLVAVGGGYVGMEQAQRSPISARGSRWWAGSHPRPIPSWPASCAGCSPTRASP